MEDESEPIVELVPFVHDGSVWRRRATSVASRAAGPRLSVATFNTWFDDHERALRTAALLRELEHHSPDLIALQEVRPDLLHALRAERWVAESYQMSDAIGTTLGRYGNVLLSRLPIDRIQLHPLPTIMGRRLLIADVHDGHQSMRIAVVHLESTAEMAGARVTQLARAYAALEASTDALLVGDLNFDSASRENAALDPRYVDVWPSLRPTEPGWTENADINVMRRRFSSDAKVRFDRVFVRSERWLPERIELLGTESVSRDRPDVFTSDHFGLLATFRRA